jgi:iron(III) transport system substrate-binding protein
MKKYLGDLIDVAVVAAMAVAGVLFWQGMAAAQSVTVYTAGPQNLADALSKGFMAKTKTKVNLFQGTTGQVMAKIAAEAANPQVDVLISAAWDTGVDLAQKEQLLDYTSPNAKNVPAALKTRNYVAQGAAALAIVWNSKTGKPKPADWADLAKPDYRNQVTMPDPAASGSAYGLVSGLVANQGLGWKFFGSMKANGTAVVGANAAALNPVMQGAKSAVFGAVDYISIAAKAKGEAIEVIYPATGTVLESRPMMIMKTSKNVAQAKQFIDYVLSDEGQKIVAGVYLLPARTDIAAKRAGWNDIKLLPADADATARKRAETLAQFKKVMDLK